MLLPPKRVGMRPAERPFKVPPTGPYVANNNPRKFRCQCLASIAKMRNLLKKGA